MLWRLERLIFLAGITLAGWAFFALLVAVAYVLGGPHG